MKTRARSRSAFALLGLLLLTFVLMSANEWSGEARAGDRVVLPNPPPYVLAEGEVSSGSGAAHRQGRPVQSPVASEEEGEASAEADRAAASPGHGNASDGELQIHSLTAWDAPDDGPSVYVSFTPISMDDFFGGVSFVRRELAGEEIEVADCAPELASSLVEVRIDGAAAAVQSLEWYYAGYGDLSGTDTKYMPVCVMRVKRPRLTEGQHGVDVRIRDAATGAVGRARTTFASGGTSERL
jgi:hypothetical protein